MEMFVVIVVIVCVSLILAYPLLRLRRSMLKYMVKKWADENSVSLMEYEEKSLQTGPFSRGNRSKNQPVCRVHVKDAKGELNTVWLKLGSPLLGLAKYKVEAVWEKNINPEQFLGKRYQGQTY